MITQQVQEGLGWIVRQSCIRPDHVGYTLRLEGVHQVAAVPCCCGHQLWVELACSSNSHKQHLMHAFDSSSNAKIA